MVYEVMLTLFPGQEEDQALVKKRILRILSDGGTHISSSEVSAIVCKKKSVDARRKDVKYHIRYAVYVGETPSNNFTPVWQNADESKQVVVVGAGPAGLFAALALLEKGIQPIVIERGCETSQRKKDIANINKSGSVNENSNYCFGEGGAGTFSDGKLYSRSNKRGDISRILSILHYHGADKEILSDAHPHVGTDKLPKIINEITATIRKFGGQVLFNTKCIDFELDESHHITAVKTLNIENNEEKTIPVKYVILATGHSADDIYNLVATCAVDHAHVTSDNRMYVLQKALEAKTYAIGVRVEHPRELIDSIQYGEDSVEKNLGSAEYRLSTQIAGRGVYSFCMCPGGYVVPSASSPDHIVVNGMSASGRDSFWSNSAFVVETRPEDIPSEFGSDVLAGLKFRANIEEEAFRQIQATNSKNPQSAPAQRLIDFLEGRLSEDLPKTSFLPGLISSRLDLWIPDHISLRLKDAFREFDTKMKGFICKEAILIAPETRTSTPIRILRDTTTCESPVLKGLFPTGEGSGYSGGIVSSAMDGENVANAIIENILNKSIS